MPALTLRGLAALATGVILAIGCPTLAQADEPPPLPDEDCPGAAPQMPAGSNTVWTQPQCLSVAESNGEVPQVAIADDGSALAVWRINDPDTNHFRVQAAYRKRGENFALVPNGGFISAGDRDVGTHIRLAMNNAGDAIVVWDAKETSVDTSIRSAFKPADGDFGAEQVVDDDTGSAPWADPEVGIDGDGTATVIYHRQPYPFNGSFIANRIYLSRDRSAGVAGTWGALDNVTGHDFGNDATPIRHNETEGTISVDEAGNRSVAFATQADGSPDDRQFVVEATRAAGVSDWSSTKIDLAGGTAEIRDFHTMVEGSDIVSIWAKGPSELDGHYKDGLQSIMGSAGEGTSPTSGSALTLDSTHDALALWAQAAFSDSGGLTSNYAPSGTGSWGSPDFDSVPGVDSDRRRPRLAADGQDDVFAVFQQKESDDRENVWAAIRPPGGTTDFDPPIQLSGVGETASADLEGDDSGTPPFGPKKPTGPVVAANDDGEGVAAWAVSDAGGNTVVQISLYVPKDVAPPPPPPPPRPKPPQPSVIQLARPLGRGAAVVLIGNVPAGVETMRWSFDQPNEPPIEGKVVNGELQRTVRLRLPNAAFRATLHTTGAGGEKIYSRTFTALRPSASSITKQVTDALQNKAPPPVFAVGSKDTLTGQSDQCAPSSIWSGEQKMSGCFKPIEDMVDIPDPERGAIHELADQLGLDESRKELMQKATQLTDGYVAQGKALLNDEFPVTPDQASQLVSIPQAKSLIAAKAELPVGSATYDPKNGFNLKLDPKKAKIPLGPLPNPPKLPSLGGLEIVGDWDVNLEKREATITASLKLPEAITKAGVRFENKIILRATPTEVIVDHAEVGPADVNIGALSVNDFKITYDRAQDEWNGQARACIISGACISMAPPDGHITIKGGKVTFAGASVIFPTPGIPLFEGVYLAKVGFGIGFDPTRIIGSARINALSLVNLDGRLVLAFPSSRAPFVLRRDEVGNDFPDSLYGQSFTATTIGMTGAVSISIPELGDIEFAHGHMLYSYPGYLALGGGFDYSLLDIISLSGGISGEVDTGTERFNVHGDIHACLFDGDICGSAIANISHGPHSAGGAGACISVGPLSVGGGVQWAHLDDPFIWPIDGCKWSRFKLDVRGAHASADHYTIDVKAGAPSPALKLYGQGGAPFVRVSGPSGSLSSTSSKGVDYSPGGTIRILRFKGNKYAGPQTVVGLQNAKPGTYRVDRLPGPGILRSARATDQPDAKVTGKVTGKGRRRLLRWNVQPRDGQRVTFQEIQPGGAAKTIAITTKGGRGKKRFTPAPGSGRRRVVAQFELNQMPAERVAVATFKPPSPRLGKTLRLRLRRKGSRVRASWRRVSGATAYQVALKLSNGQWRFKTTHRRKVTLTRIPRYSRRSRDRARDRQDAPGRRFRSQALQARRQAARPLPCARDLHHRQEADQVRPRRPGRQRLPLPAATAPRERPPDRPGVHRP